MNTGEIMRMIANLIKEGVVKESDPAGKVRVEHGGLVSDWLPYFVPAAGGVSIHRPPSVGERCLIFSPSGETANAVVLCGLASTRHPAPAQTDDITVVRFPDGATAAYNHISGGMSIHGIQTGHIQAEKSLTFDTPQTTFTGNVTINQQTTSKGLLTYQSGMTGSGGAGTVIEGTITHQGRLVNTGRISSNGIVLDDHEHDGVAPGGGNTGKPVK